MQRAGYIVINYFGVEIEGTFKLALLMPLPPFYREPLPR